MSEQTDLNSDVNEQMPFKISVPALLLDLVGMFLVALAGYEFYCRAELGTSLLSDYISWPQYPWLLLIIGLLLMVPFHKQIFAMRKVFKQQQIEAKKRNLPDY